MQRRIIKVLTDLIDVADEFYVLATDDPTSYAGFLPVADRAIDEAIALRDELAIDVLISNIVKE